MKLIFILSTILISQFSFANCPNSFQRSGSVYCISIDWDKADQLKRGKYVSTNVQSPVLNKMNARGKNKLFSKAEVRLWLASDASETEILLKGLRVFPYMIMNNGHHHGASHDWIQHANSYELAGIGFMKMMGCWQLRISFDGNTDMFDSELLANISTYSNLSVAEQRGIAKKCGILHP